MGQCRHENVSRSEIKDRVVCSVLDVVSVGFWCCDSCGERFMPVDYARQMEDKLKETEKKLKQSEASLKDAEKMLEDLQAGL